MVSTALLFMIVLAIPTVLPAPADPGGVSTTTTAAQLASAVVSPPFSQSFQSPSSLSTPVDTTYLLSQSPSPSQAAVKTATTTVVTNIVTTTIAITPTSTTTVVETVTATTTVTTTSTPWAGRTAWAAPPEMTDLSAFNVTHFPSGKQNVAIINGFSALASVPGGSAYEQDISESHNITNITGFTAALQLHYPADSVDPSSKSPGGAEFYATPLNLSDAKNVTIEYSVFFPLDFDWVKGGKLPGLYGDHTGCSGGAAAEDCFSTRLMWRPGGAGELYLYAPKEKQTKALCSNPQSVCDYDYGLSIDRGSFHYSRGNWTNLRQDVVLNTPVKQDGVFVDGKQAINRTDIFYRDAPQQKKEAETKDHIQVFYVANSTANTRWSAGNSGCRDEQCSQPSSLTGSLS